jgi:hypothetical protein
VRWLVFGALLRRWQAWIHGKPYQKRFEFVPLTRISPDLQFSVDSLRRAPKWAAGTSQQQSRRVWQKQSVHPHP